MNQHNIKGQIHNAMYHNIRKNGYVAPIDVLMDIGILDKKDYEDWRFGRVVFLEKVCKAKPRMLSEIMHEIRTYAAKNKLKPSWTHYHQWGKNKKQKLRFSKSNDDKIEQNYATHYIGVKMADQKSTCPTDPPG